VPEGQLKGGLELDAVAVADGAVVLGVGRGRGGEEDDGSASFRRIFSVLDPPLCCRGTAATTECTDSISALICGSATLAYSSRDTTPSPFMSAIPQMLSLSADEPIANAVHSSWETSCGGEVTTMAVQDCSSAALSLPLLSTSHKTERASCCSALVAGSAAMSC